MTDLNGKGAAATTVARVRKQPTRAGKAGKPITTTPGFTGFTPAALTFLRGLQKNNRKEWFEDHRPQYEQHVRAPMLALVEEMDVRLASIIPEIIGSPKKSMFRIHRDVRFSKDKSPYKTHAACWFYHRDAGHGVGGEAAHGGAGFYFHFEPTGSFCGGGIWMPPRPALQRIRQSLMDDHEGFEDIVHDKAFKRRFGTLSEESMLTRLPRGVDPMHPAQKWLKYQSFTAGRELTKEELLSPKLPSILAKDYATMVPFIRWLNDALGLRASSAR